jgi:hypothetical protein
VAGGTIVPTGRAADIADGSIIFPLIY